MSSARVSSLSGDVGPARRFPAGVAASAMDWRDALVLYGAAAVALASTMVAVGVAGDLGLGVLGALLTSAGVALSWRVGRWRPRWAVPLGLGLGLAAALLWVSRVRIAAAADEAILGGNEVEIGMALAVPMGALLILLSFLMLRGGVVGFSMVPALSIFGLISGRVDQDLEQLCFMVFLPAALTAVGWVMVLPGGEITVPESRLTQWRMGQWRVRHWWTLAALIGLVLGLGYLIAAPVSVLGEAYRWQIIAGVMNPEGDVPAWRMTDPPAEVSVFRVGTGPVVASDFPMLAVSGPGAQYWRGLVYDQYTGSAWMRSRSGAPLAVEDIAQRPGPRRSVLDLSGRVPRAAGQPQTHRVEALTDMPFVIYSPGWVQRASIPVPDRLLTPLSLDPFSTVEVPGGWLARGQTYEVVSVPLATAEEAARAVSARASREPAAGLAEGWLRDNESYRQVPMSASRVAELASQIAGEARTPEGKLAALISYLQRNYVYSLNAPAVPRGQDAAEHFLFRQKRGHCDLFATSLALMARGVGIPTRVATGFLDGVYDEKRQAWVLRDADRHAWVEAFLPSTREWVTVDATPGAGDESNRPRGAYLAWLRLRFFWQDHPFAAWGMVLAAFLLAWYVVARVRRARAGAPPPPTSEDRRAMVAYAYWQFLRRLRRFGLPRRFSQTPLEYLASLEAATGGELAATRRFALQAALPAARSLTDVFLFARYSPGPVTPDEVSAAQALVREVAVALRRRRKAAQQPSG